MPHEFFNINNPQALVLKKYDSMKCFKNFGVINSFAAFDELDDIL